MKIYNLLFLLLFTVSSSFLLLSSQPGPMTKKAGRANLVFKSTDGGQTWQDISKGLPENLNADSIQVNSFFANDKGLFLRTENGLYHSAANATTPFWTKESLTSQQSIAPGKPGILYWGGNLIKTNGTSVWSPIFEIFHRPGIRTAFETAGGAIFIGTDRGFFKTADNGKTWKQVHAGNLVGHLAESNGVLVAISAGRIIRSTDDGENWSEVNSEDGVVFDVKQIKGGFVAITSNSEPNNPNTRRLSTSYDGGKTWQPIHSSLQNKVLIDSIGRTWNDRQYLQRFSTSIIQVGEAFLCTHPDGIFRSSDKGKTWKLLLSSIDDKVFKLFVSGGVIYAIRSKGGC